MVSYNLLDGSLVKKEHEQVKIERCAMEEGKGRGILENKTASTPVHGQIKVKNWVCIVVIPQTITSYR